MATLVREQPLIDIGGPNQTGRAFFTRFISNCDLQGTNLTQFYRQVLY